MSSVELFTRITNDIRNLRTNQQRLLIAIDGADGSGKSTFAAHLTDYLIENGIPTLHTSIDGFHKPRDERYARGRQSPEGFFLDSYDYATFKKYILDPFRSSDTPTICLASHDVETDTQLPYTPTSVPKGTTLIIDGMFLHRDELLDYWDYSIFLDADFSQTYKRMALRDGSSPDPFDTSNTRYREGQLLYFATCNPKSRATIIIDNNDFNHPAITHSSH